MSFGWPDIIIVIAATLMAHNGWKRGFISELGGIVALVGAVAGALFYPGWWDGTVEWITRLHGDSAHVLALFLFALFIYGLFTLLGVLLEKNRSHKYVKSLNSPIGALLGVVKAAALFWLIIYVALFFPLSRDLRYDLRHSFFVPILAQNNDQIDRKLRYDMPWFVRPFSTPIFRRHRF